jgi:hypothetical protein
MYTNLFTILHKSRNGKIEAVGCKHDLRSRDACAAVHASKVLVLLLELLFIQCFDRWVIRCERPVAQCILSPCNRLCGSIARFVQQDARLDMPPVCLYSTSLHNKLEFQKSKFQ